MSYQSIRNKIMKNETAFKLIRFFFTPIRMLREYSARKKMADEFIIKYSNVSKETRKVFYFGIPEHNNLGDIAQTYCTEKWLSECFPKHVIIEARTRVTFNRRFVKFIREIINYDDFILFQSGYCTRHNNPDHLMHLHIAKEFPRERIVVLPQTVKLDYRTDIEKTKKVFSGCSRLTFITRDSLSRDFAAEFIDQDRLECFPDIVTSLIGREEIRMNREGVLLCLRNDDEKFYSDDELDKLSDKLQRIFKTVFRTDTNSEKSTDEVFSHLRFEVTEKIKQFAQFECVITDRYHGTIFSLIADTPVIVIRTNDHKVTSALQWFSQRYVPQAVRYADSLDKALTFANEIHDKKFSIQNNDSLYKEYYQEKLRMLIESV